MPHSPRREKIKNAFKMMFRQFIQYYWNDVHSISASAKTAVIYAYWIFKQSIISTYTDMSDERKKDGINAEVKMPLRSMEVPSRNIPPDFRSASSSLIASDFFSSTRISRKLLSFLHVSVLFIATRQPIGRMKANEGRLRGNYLIVLVLEYFFLHVISPWI